MRGGRAHEQERQCSDVVLHIFNYMFVESRCYPKLSFNMMYPIKGTHKMRERKATMKAFSLDAETFCSLKTPHLLINLS